MAQLPPKIPNTSTPNNWPEFSPHHQKMPSLSSIPSNTNHAHHQNNPSWVDEFLDFSSARRGAHRRSVSDSRTFMESPATLVEDSARRSSRNSGDYGDFDRFDDEQFLSMFSDNPMTAGPPPPALTSSSNPSSPSDHNSINDKKETMNKEIKENEIMMMQQQQQQVKNESDEDESLLCKQEIIQNNVNASTCSSDKITDPKRVKRILANRQSAQRSRVRKLQYISELERSVTSLQAEVSVLSPRVAYLDHQRLLLNVDNSALKQRIAALAQDKIFKDAHQEALKREIERLRQVYHNQNIKKMDVAAGSPSPSSPSPSPSPRPLCDQTHQEHEQLINV